MLGDRILEWLYAVKISLIVALTAQTRGFAFGERFLGIINLRHFLCQFILKNLAAYVIAAFLRFSVNFGEVTWRLGGGLVRRDGIERLKVQFLRALARNIGIGNPAVFIHFFVDIGLGMRNCKHQYHCQYSSHIFTAYPDDYGTRSILDSPLADVVPKKC